MIKSQRKRHLQIWALWAVLIPVGIIVAWIAVPKRVTQELLQKATSRNTKVIIASAENKNYKVTILLDTTKRGTIANLEFISKERSTGPVTLLYWLTDLTTENIDKQELLGRVDGKAVYHFQLMNIIVGSSYNPLYKAKFILYDTNKKKIIDTITVKPTLLGPLL